MLLVSFELHSPNRNYLDVEKAIASLGDGIRAHTYFWCIESPLTATDAAIRLWQVMDERDSVLVVDSSNHEAAWKHLPHDVAGFIKERLHPEERTGAGKRLHLAPMPPVRRQESALLRTHRPASGSEEEPLARSGESDSRSP